MCQFRNARELALWEFPGIPYFFGKIRAGNGKIHIEIFTQKLLHHFRTFIQEKIVQNYKRKNFYVTFPGTPRKIPGNSGSTELRRKFCPTLVVCKFSFFPVASNIGNRLVLGNIHAYF